MKTITGEWINQHGSRMTVEVQANGTLSGRFMPGTGIGAQQEFPLVGFASDRLVAFTVNFASCGALTAWTGHLTRGDDGTTLDTLWHMTLQMPRPDGDSDDWKTLWTGSDVFMRAGTVARRRPSSAPSYPLLPPTTPA